MGASEAFTTAFASSADVGHFINGQHVPGGSGRSQPVYNPATGQVARQLALASADDVAAAEKVVRARRFNGPAPESASEALALLARDLDDALAAVAAHHAMTVGDRALQQQVALVFRERPVLASIASRFFDADAPRSSSALERSRV